MNEKTMDYKNEYFKLKTLVDTHERELLSAYKKLSHLTDEKPKSNIDLKTLIIQDMEKLIKDTNVYLIENGIQDKVKDLKGILEALNKLRVLKPSQAYLGVTLDSDGYIKTVSPLHDFVLEQDAPNDLTQGYYKIKNGEFYLDVERQALLWRNE